MVSLPGLSQKAPGSQPVLSRSDQPGRDTFHVNTYSIGVSVCRGHVTCVGDGPAGCLLSTPAHRATGENYHVEFGGKLWDPTPNILIGVIDQAGSSAARSTSSRTSASRSNWFTQLKVVLRPATKHKFRFEYTPIRYEATDGAAPGHRLQRHRIPVALPVESRTQVERLSIRLRMGLRLSRSRVRRHSCSRRSTRTSRRR